MITVKSQFAFFDSPKVTRAVDQIKRRELARAGGYVRQTAKRSIRKRKRASLPGQPPSSHTGDLRKIFFGFDQGNESVVVGPLKFKKGNAPEVLEKGGTATVISRNKRTGKIERHQVKIEKRPYMNPALIKTVPQFPTLFKGKLKG